jgi:hypothetical protein
MDSNPSLRVHGKLHVYSLSPRLVAFESGPPKTTSAFVYVGDLGVGLAASPVILQLQATIARFGWSLVEPIRSSSFNQWGRHSIETDVAEMNRLCEYLKGQGKNRIVLLGHGTGTSPAQQALSYPSSARC